MIIKSQTARPAQHAKRQAPGHLITYMAVLSLAFLAPNSLMASDGDDDNLPTNTSSEWPKIGFDRGNSNNNNSEKLISVRTTPFLRELWQIDPVLPPTLFGVDLGPSSSSIIVDGKAHFADQFGGLRTVNANTGVIINESLVNCPGFLELGEFFCDLVQRSPLIKDELIYTHSIGLFSPPSSFLGVSRLSDLSNVSITTTSEIPGSPFPFVTTPNQESVLSDILIVEDVEIAGDSRTLLLGSAASNAQRYARGRIFAYDITEPQNISQLWETFTTSDTLAETCPAYAQAAGSWSTPVADQRLGLVYFGVGNPELSVADQRALNGCTEPDRIDTPASQQDLNNSLVALDIKTGDVVAQNRFSIGDIYNQSRDPNLFVRGHFRRGANSDQPSDVDVTGFATLIDIGRTRHGVRSRRLIGMGDKAGRYKVMDRATLETVYEFHIGINATDFGGISTSGAVVDGHILYVGMTSTDTPAHPVDWRQVYRDLVGQEIPPLNSDAMKRLVANYVTALNPMIDFDTLTAAEQEFLIEQHAIDPNRAPKPYGGPYGMGSPGGLDYMDVQLGLIGTGQSPVPLARRIPVFRVARINLRNGVIEWITEVASGVTFSPLVYANGVLFIGGRNGSIHALRGRTGEILSSINPANPNDLFALAIANGKIYASSAQGLQAYGLVPHLEARSASTPLPYFSGDAVTPIIDDAKARSPFRNRWAGITVEVVIGSGFEMGDMIEIDTDRQLRVVGNKVIFRRKKIGTIITADDSRLVVQLTRTARSHDVNQLIQHIGFTSTTTVVGIRSIEFRLSTLDQVQPRHATLSTEIDVRL